MHTLLTNIKELFDLFNCTKLYQDQYIAALHKAHEAADAKGETNARVKVMFSRAQRCGVQYEKAHAEYAEARAALYLALGI